MLGNWPKFEQRDGFLVSKFENIFEILSDITKDKSQSSLDDFGGRNKRAPVKKKISPEYEQEEQDFSQEKRRPSNYRPGKSDVDLGFDEMENEFLYKAEKHD